MRQLECHNVYINSFTGENVVNYSIYTLMWFDYRNDIGDPNFISWDWIGSHPMGSLFSLELLHPQWMNLCRHHEASTTKTRSPLSQYGILPLYFLRGHAWFLRGALGTSRSQTPTMRLEILYRGVQGYSLFSLSVIV